MKIEFRSHALLAAVAATAILAAGVAQTTVTGQPNSSSTPKSTTPKSATLKTSWGTPDLQGTWSNVAVVPFERPKEYGDREFKTDAELKAATEELLKNNELPGRDSREGRDGKDIRGTEQDVARAYNEHFFGDKPTVVGRRTSQIVDPPDGRMPALTPEAQARISKKAEYVAALLQGTSGGKPGPISARRNEPSPDYNLERLNRTDGPEDRSNMERCLAIGLPVIVAPGQLTPDGKPYGNFGGMIRIIESPDSVGMYYDIGQGWGFNRVVPITNRPHISKDVRQYWGDSVAHWDGDTLLVDVTNFSQETDFPFNGFNGPRGARETLHLIERYKRVDAKTLEITITADDPSTWVKPITFVQDLTKNADKPNMVYEAGCHEGNHGLMDMMISTRAAEKLFKEGKGSDPALDNNGF